MKKLMIAAVAICAAVAANAAAANWKSSASAMKDGFGSAATIYSGAAYIFNADTISQSSLYDMLAGNLSTDLTKVDGYKTTATIGANGAFGNATYTHGEQGDGQTYAFYFVCVNADDEMVYFSNEISGKPNGNSTAKNMGFASQANSSLEPEGTTFQGAGRWSAVPEPTSAMLLLLGVAGLALKRKQK